MQKAVEIVVALAQIYGAADLVEVDSAQVSGVSYKNLGDAGLEFLEEWAEQGARARVPAMLNPAGMDREAWRELGFPDAFARRQEAVIEAYSALGIRPTCTCAPYLVEPVPAFGHHVAWAESSAVSYVNSVVGARTNREGGPSALAAAIAGRTARYGLHLDQKRSTTMRIEVHCPVESEADLGALGYMVGLEARAGVPYFRFHGRTVEDAHLRTLGAAMAASGAVALYHVEGATPEAQWADQLAEPGLQTLVVDDLSPGFAALNGPAERIDLVSIGCPHASLSEIEAIAQYLAGRHVRATLWITTAQPIRQRAASAGLEDRIEEAGGRLVADTCMVVAPIADLGFHALATNSAKMALYAPAHSGLAVRYGRLEQCLEAAITGYWPGAAHRPSYAGETGGRDR